MITTKIKEKIKSEVSEPLLRVRRKMQVKFNPGLSAKQSFLVQELTCHGAYNILSVKVLSLHSGIQL